MLIRGILLFAFIFNCKIVFTQTITFERTFGTSSYNIGWSVKQLPDSGFIITGKSNWNTNPSYYLIFLIRTDKYGDTLWRKTYCGFEARTVELTNDTDIIIAGTNGVCSGNFGNGDLYIIKTNLIGDTLWSRTYGNNGLDQGFSVQQTIEGGFILCGWTTTYSNIIKTTSTGDTTWTRYLPVEALSSIKQTYDGGYIVAGWTGIFVDPYYIARLDTAGYIQWYKTFYDSNFSSFMDIIQTPDSGFIASGEGQQLFKVNAQGDSVWSSLQGQGGYAIDNTSDGGFITGGNGGILGLQFKKWDSNNNLQWVKSYKPGPNYLCNANSVQQTSDGGYVACGFATISGNQQVYLVKTDSLGNVYTGINENEPEKTQGMVYPNPINDVGYLLLVNQNYSALKNISFILYDVTGKEFRKEKIASFPFKIERKDLKSGMYFYKVADEKGLMVSGKIIMQ